MSRIYDLLEHPRLYRLITNLLAPGSDSAFSERIDSLIRQLPSAEEILDVGCGPSSWLWRAGLHPIGLDYSPVYSLAFHRAGEPAATASADALPFPGESFEGVWSIGMLHHLPPAMAQQAVQEMMRVCRPGGYIAIFDAVLPEPAWKRPLAYALRRVDRGQYVRAQSSIEQLLPGRQRWATGRHTYSSTGLEILVCVLIKEDANRAS